jgi:hypothetical protein
MNLQNAFTKGNDQSCFFKIMKRNKGYNIRFEEIFPIVLLVMRSDQIS